MGDKYKEALTKYLGKYIVDRIDNDSVFLIPNKPVSKSISVLVVDWKDFTSVPKGITAGNLNDAFALYLEKVSEVIISHNGFIENIIGNALICLFGLENDDYMNNACKAAIDCIKIEKEISDELDINFMIGIASGDALIGNLGSEHKIVFQALGLPKNTANRLSLINQSYKTKILIDDKTKQSVSNAFYIRFIDNIAIKKGPNQIEKFALNELVDIKQFCGADGSV